MPSSTSSSNLANSLRNSNSSSRSTPPSDCGEASKREHRELKYPKRLSQATSTQSEMFEEENIFMNPGDVPEVESSNHQFDSEIEAIFEQTASEDSEAEHQSIPDYQYDGPRNHSRMSLDDDFEDQRTPPQLGSGFDVKSATAMTAEAIAAGGGLLFPNSIHSPTPPPFVTNKSRKPLHLAGKELKDYMSDPHDFSPARSSPRSSRHGSKQSPKRRSRKQKIVTAPSPEPEPEMELEPEASPLVLLHVTLLPLPVQGPASSVLVAHLRKMISPTVVARGLLLPHPQDDYDLLLDMISENLGLDDETPPPFRKTLSTDEDDQQSHSDASYLSDDDQMELEPFHSHCPVCHRRRLKPDYMRHDKPRRQRMHDIGDKWYTINIFASNGLMRQGAWNRSWEEMERIDVEVKVTPGFEDIGPAVIPVSESDKRSQRGSRSGSLRSKSYVKSLDTSSDEGSNELPQRIKTRGTRKSSTTKSNRSFKRSSISPYINPELPSEIDAHFNRSNATEIFSDREIKEEMPIFTAPSIESTTFVDIWDEKPVERPVPERLRSEDAWETDDEEPKREVKMRVPTAPSPPTASSPPPISSPPLQSFPPPVSSPPVLNATSREFSNSTTVHHETSSRDVSMDFVKDKSPDSDVEASEALRPESSPIRNYEDERESSVLSQNISPESSKVSIKGEPDERIMSEERELVESPVVSRQVSGVHRLHPSSRRSSCEIKSEDTKVAAEPRPEPVRHSTDLTVVVGLAVSEDGNPDDDSISEHTFIHSDDENASEPDQTRSESVPPAHISDEDEDEDDYLRQPSPMNKPSDTAPMPQVSSPRETSPASYSSSPVSSADVSPIASRTVSPVRNAKSRTKPDTQKRKSPSPEVRSRKFSSRKVSSSSVRSISSMEDSEYDGPSKKRGRNRGRRQSKSASRSRSSSSHERDQSFKPVPIPFLMKCMQDMRKALKPTVDVITNTPLPTLLLIFVPIVSLIAFSVNSYTAQKNLDQALQQFAAMQRSQQAQYAVKADEEPWEIRRSTPYNQNIKQEIGEKHVIVDEGNIILSDISDKEVLHEKPLLYGVEVGGRCVMPENVVEAINSVRHEMDPNAVTVTPMVPVSTAETTLTKHEEVDVIQHITKTAINDAAPAVEKHYAFEHDVAPSQEPDIPEPKPQQSQNTFSRSPSPARKERRTRSPSPSIQPETTASIEEEVRETTVHDTPDEEFVYKLLAQVQHDNEEAMAQAQEQSSSSSSSSPSYSHVAAQSVTHSEPMTTATATTIRSRSPTRRVTSPSPSSRAHSPEPKRSRSHSKHRSKTRISSPSREQIKHEIVTDQVGQEEETKQDQAVIQMEGSVEKPVQHNIPQNQETSTTVNVSPSSYSLTASFSTTTSTTTPTVTFTTSASTSSIASSSTSSATFSSISSRPSFNISPPASTDVPTGVYSNEEVVEDVMMDKDEVKDYATTSQNTSPETMIASTSSIEISFTQSDGSSSAAISQVTTLTPGQTIESEPQIIHDYNYHDDDDDDYYYDDDEEEEEEEEDDDLEYSHGEDFDYEGFKKSLNKDSWRE